jgi:ribosome-associated protein
VLEDVRVNDRLTIPAAELAWRFSRSSGPGGQGVNTTDSRVELSWDVAGSPLLPPTLKERALGRLGPRLVQGVLTVTASEHRSQLRNRRAAEDRLAAMLEEAMRPPRARRVPTKPSKGSQQRRIQQKKKRGEIKRLRGRPED